MTGEEKIIQIDSVYNKAQEEIGALGKKRKEIARDYIKELENKRIDEIHASLGVINN